MTSLSAREALFAYQCLSVSVWLEEFRGNWQK